MEAGPGASRAVSGAPAGERAQAAGPAPAEPAAAGRGRPAQHARARALPKARIPDSLLAVCRKALALDPAHRYPSVEDLQRDLTAYQNGFATSAEKAGWFKRASLTIQRNKAASLGAAAVLLVGLTFGTKAVLEGRRANRALAELKKGAPALLQLAESEAGFQRFDSALEKLDAALTLDPGLLAAQWQRAWMLLGEGRWSEAAAQLQRSRAKDSTHPDWAAIQPQIERLATMEESKRAGCAEGRAVVSLLQSVGANGAATALVTKLQLGRDAAVAAVRERLTKWLGPEEAGRVSYGYLGFSGIVANLKGLNVTTIDPLIGLPVEKLILSDSKVANLDGVRGMPLRELDIVNTTISDLRPLAGLPLVRLRMGGANVSDLTPLRETPLQYLDASHTKVANLSPLGGMHLRSLNLNDIKVRDLSALVGMPLDELHAAGSEVTDLSPLKGMPLTRLILNSTRVSDLAPLRGLPLRELDIHNCSAALDLAVLLAFPELEMLEVQEKNPTLPLLRKHPRLRLIKLWTATTRPTDYQPIEEFWKDYDGQQAAGKK